jgi:methionyl-tRNA formyltransferase
MNYVFFGSPRFAASVLEKLLDAEMPPVALVCNPDRPAGRKKIITPPATKELILRRAPEAVLLQPETPAEAAETFKTLGADLFVVAAYAHIIPEAILAIPRAGALGVHPSLLPKYRGASPIQTAILNGEPETGVSVYVMDAKMDHGPIVASAPCAIKENDSYQTLEEKLAALGGTLMVSTMPEFILGKRPAETQDEVQATYTKKFKTQDGFIDDDDLKKAERGDAAAASMAYRKIRALTLEPGCWTMRNGKRIKLLEATMNGPALVLTVTQMEGETPRRISS